MLDLDLPPPQKGHDDDDSDGYETEERDPEVNSGVFPSVVSPHIRP